MTWWSTVLVWSPLMLAADVSGQTDGGQSAYAGQQHREIRSLSADDVAELRRGGGWGLAKAAELNGVPGPVHLLELRHEIPLTADQIARLEEIFAEMRAEAQQAGEVLIAAEAELDRAFATGTITDARLRDLLAAVEKARSRLRYIHLSRHLMTVPLLSEQQIRRYNTLRGYTSDPCASVPEGHDAAMWRRHNGCD